MLSEEQGIDNAIETGSQRGGWGLGLGNQMPGFGAGEVELAPEISERDVDITHGHLGRRVAE